MHVTSVKKAAGSWIPGEAPRPTAPSAAPPAHAIAAETGKSVGPDAILPEQGEAWFTCRNLIGRANDWRRRWAAHTPIATLLQEALLRQLTKGRPPIGLPVLLAVVLAATVWSSSAVASGCYRYGQVVTLSGHYFAEVAPVDDGSIRDPRNDAARRATLLKMTTPYCVNADVLSHGVAAALDIQLACPALRQADGDALSVTGRLLGAHTGNGQTPVVLMCL